MKKRSKYTFLLALLLAISTMAFGNGPTKHGVDTTTVFNFYANAGLPIDSCTNTHLYFSVYGLLNTPYKYGGRGEHGLDCSGFSIKIYEEVFRIGLQGGSRDIFKNTHPLTIEEAQPGDLLFFKIRKNQISHVGVYLGQGKFAHASTRAGVIISDLSEPYYQRTFYSAGRLSN